MLSYLQEFQFSGLEAVLCLEFADDRFELSDTSSQISNGGIFLAQLGPQLLRRWEIERRVGMMGKPVRESSYREVIGLMLYVCFWLQGSLGCALNNMHHGGRGSRERESVC